MNDIVTDNYVFQTWFKKHDSKKLLVFLSAAVDRSQHELPVFNRKNWADLYDANVLCISDPTLEYDPDLRCGWYMGNEKGSALVELSGYISKLGYNDITFYGSSAGGFAALVLGGMVENSTVVCINPQTDLNKYPKHFIDKMISCCFPNNNIDYKRFKAENYWNNNNSSKIIYVQNILDNPHYQNDFIPFCQSVLCDERHTQLLYNDKRGHAPEPEHIRTLLQNHINS